MKPGERRAVLALAGALDRVGESAEAEAAIGALLDARPADVQARIVLASLLARHEGPEATATGRAARAARADEAIAELRQAAAAALEVGDASASQWCEREIARLAEPEGEGRGAVGPAPTPPATR
jgi:hypothetical protein